MSAIKLTNVQVAYTASMYDMFLRKSRLRLGQHLCNTYAITDPEIFYEKNNEVSLAKFREKYAR